MYLMSVLVTDERSDVVFNVCIGDWWNKLNTTWLISSVTYTDIKLQHHFVHQSPIQTLNTSLNSSVTYTDIKYNITYFISHLYKH